MGDGATIFSLYPLAVFCAATAIVAFRTRALPRWLAAGAAATAAALAVNGAFLGAGAVPALLLFLLWTLVTSVYLLRRTWRSRPPLPRPGPRRPKRSPAHEPSRPTGSAALLIVQQGGRVEQRQVRQSLRQVAEERAAGRSNSSASRPRSLTQAVSFVPQLAGLARVPVPHQRVDEPERARHEGSLDLARTAEAVEQRAQRVMAGPDPVRASIRESGQPIYEIHV